jgi:hypothetical protein
MRLSVGSIHSAGRSKWKGLELFSFHFVQSPGGISFKHAPYFIPDAAERLHLFLISAHGVRGIIKAPMMAVSLAGESWAGLVGIAANSDDRFHRLLEKVVHVLGSMRRDVDTDFGKRRNCERVNVASRFAAGAGDFEFTFAGGAKNAFGHVAAAGVAGAKNENERFGVLHFELVFSGNRSIFRRSTSVVQRSAAA